MQKVSPVGQSLPVGAVTADSGVLARVDLDLDLQSRFRESRLELRSGELRWESAGEPARVWPLRPDLRLSHDSRAGVGVLTLEDASGMVARWRHTQAGFAAVQRLRDVFGQLIRGELAEGVGDASSGAACPVCHTPLPADQEDCPSCAAAAENAPSTWILLRLWRFARPYKRQLLLGFVLTLASTFATLVPPYLTMPLMDQVLIPSQQGKGVDFALAASYLGALLAAAILAWGLGYWRTYILALVAERIGADMRNTTFRHLLGLSLEYFGGKRTGDLIARIGAETDRICVFLSLQLLDFATDLVMIAMTAIILASIDPMLAVVTLTPLPFIVWLVYLVRDRLRFGFDQINRTWGEVTNVLADTIPGIRVVKAFAQESREVARFAELNQKNLRMNDRVNRVWALFSPTVTLCTEIGLLVVWAFGIWLVAHDRVTVGVLTAFLAYIGRFFTRIDSMSRIVSFTQQAAAGAKRIFDVLDCEPSVPPPHNPAPLGEVRGQIELRNVTFQYGNHTVLRDIDLAIRPGELVGLIGHSGSGKSTLANLICRFYDASHGSITLDGRDVRSIELGAYRQHIGVVLQEPFLFFGTIAENIAYGRPQASRAEIVAAARAANAHEFILRLPFGYDSLVGERGQSLSGGERQRISIARALLTNPRILILDEATSAVDSTTEKEIQKALDRLVLGRTTIAIAHRLSTLRKADRLVVLDKGRIVEEGTHEALMAAQGAYYRFYLNQSQQDMADA
jgi:ATP-binding cassette subfamily B protein